jgi:hypothetical protein
MTYRIHGFKTLIRGIKHILLQQQIGGVVTSLGLNSCKKCSTYTLRTKLEIDAGFLSLTST